MFTKSKIVRFGLIAALAAATWLPMGSGPLEPAQAKAFEIVRGRYYRPGYAYVGPRYIAPAPVVVAAPVVTPTVVAPTVVVPTFVGPRVVYRPGYRYGYHWYRR
jgi:hypothetical protein